MQKKKVERSENGEILIDKEHTHIIIRLKKRNINGSELAKVTDLKFKEL